MVKMMFSRRPPPKYENAEYATVCNKKGQLLTIFIQNTYFKYFTQVYIFILLWIHKLWPLQLF